LTPIRDREFFIYNLLVRIHFITEMIWRTGLAPLEFEFPLPSKPETINPKSQILTLNPKL